MQLTAVFLLAFSLTLSARTLSQNITFSGTGVPLERVFAIIKQQTGYHVMSNQAEVRKMKKISVDVKEVPLHEFLDIVFKGIPLEYVIKGKSIFIHARKMEEGPRVILEAPPINIRGRIVNENGEPVVATVMIKGTNKGTTSSEDGYFEFNNVDENAVLIISASNIETVTYTVKKQASFTISVKMTTASLNEVVINKGYYSEKQKLTTGNVTKITSKEINGQPITSPLISLQGRVAGLEVTPANGASGIAPRVRIRGENSLRHDGGYPLYVIDGVIIDSRPLQSSALMYERGIDPLANISPEIIASIEVLKDADATAIYGSRGANGVILVTTKKGGSSDLNVNVAAYNGVGKMPEMMDLLNRSQYLEMRKEAFVNGGFAPSEYDFDITLWDTSRSTDWQDLLLGGTSNISDLQLNFNGGNSSTTFGLGAGYHKETSIVSDNFGYDRANMNLSFHHKPLGKKISIDASINYGLNNNDILNVNQFIQNALMLSPVSPKLFHEDGSLNWEIRNFGAIRFATFQNPMAELLNTHDVTSRSLIANSVIRYDLHKNLSVSVNAGLTSTDEDEILKRPISYNPPTSISSGVTGSAIFGSNTRKSWLAEPQVTWSRQLNNHKIDFLIGSTFQGSSAQRQAIYASGYGSDALLNSLKGATSYFITNDNTQYRYMALFSRLGYSYKDKYILNLTGRRDGSSRFGEGNKFGNFGAVAAAWVFSNEEFLNASFLSHGKIRATYGITGNDQIGDYQFYDLYTVALVKYQNFTTLEPKALFNENFKWEVTKKAEVSLETSFLGDRISLQATWYRNTTSNQLINYQLPVTTGFASIFKNFPAVIENKGWEFNVVSGNISRPDFSWTTNFNLTIPNNVLKSFPDIEDSPYKDTYKVGEPLSVQNRYVWAGVDPGTGLHRLKDFDDNNQINALDMRFGKSFALKYYGGITNTVRYKSIELSFLIQFSKRLGKGPFIDYPGFSPINQPVEVMHRWTKEGDQTNIPKFSTNYLDALNFSNILDSDYNIVNASFVKIRTLSVSYQFPYELLRKIKVSDIKVFFHGQNLFTFSKFVGYDPETGANVLPQLRILTAGLKLKI